MMWPQTEISRAVIVSPSHRYNPKKQASHGRQWERAQPALPLGHKRELFYKDNNGWTYMGIFECKKVLMLSIEQLKGLGRIVSC